MMALTDVTKTEDRYSWKHPDTGDVVHYTHPLSINAGCGTHYAAGWVNTDLVWNSDTHPDLLVTDNEPLPFPDDSASRVYLGHVLEHLRLEQIPPFLAEVRRVMQPGGRLLVTGPDAYRTLDMWHRGEVGWALVTSVLEHAAHPGTTDWPGALHQWNCREERVVEMLTLAGFVDLLRGAPHEVEARWHGWPIVNWSGWQCCVSAVNP